MDAVKIVDNLLWLILVTDKMYDMDSTDMSVFQAGLDYIRKNRTPDMWLSAVACNLLEELDDN